jgi:hypothetical protein
VFAVGTLLAGKYRIDRIIGQGGMGMVVAATHIHLQQQVALKFLLPEFLNNTQVVERFVREARASAALRGEHVCRVSDVGALDMGAPYIVMELLEGVDLATLLVQQGTMQVAQACDYVLQASIGVAEAHGMSIVHRDLKPANLFLTRRPDGTPQIKVLDFGIAKAQGDSNLNLTKTTSILGSPGYMSPEQLRSSKDVDIRSDIWSLGVILYELVTGRPPFTGESITELAIRVTMAADRADAARLRSGRQSLPREGQGAALPRPREPRPRARRVRRPERLGDGEHGVARAQYRAASPDPSADADGGGRGHPATDRIRPGPVGRGHTGADDDGLVGRVADHQPPGRRRQAVGHHRGRRRGRRGGDRDRDRRRAQQDWWHPRAGRGRAAPAPAGRHRRRGRRARGSAASARGCGRGRPGTRARCGRGRGRAAARDQARDQAQDHGEDAGRQDHEEDHEDHEGSRQGDQTSRGGLR